MLQCLYRVCQRLMYSAHITDAMIGKEMLTLNVHTD
jgi:hypothetical protein